MDDSGTAVAVAPAPTTSTPASPPSSPASSTAERPTSFADAFKTVGDPAPPNPGDPTAVVPPPVAAIPPPQPETPPVVAAPTPETKGPIPFDRHEAALKNARTKAAQETEQKFQTQYAPHIAFGQKFQADPVGTIAQSVAELANHPEFGPKIISELARTLGARGRSQATQTDQAPGPDLQTADGIQVYSAEQQAKREAWFEQRMTATIDKRLDPLQKREQEFTARERYAAGMKDADARMSKVVAPYQALPEYEANRPEIAKRTQALMTEGHDPQTALGVAVVQVLREVVLPSRAAQSQQSLTAQAVAKATGSTVAPGASPSAPVSRPTSMLEAFGRIEGL